ncbi:hypothetical protein ACEXTD_003037 [Salmonella enterica]
MSSFGCLQLCEAETVITESTENGTGQPDTKDGRYFITRIRAFSSRVARRALPERSRINSGLSFLQPLTAASPNRRGALPFHLMITWLSYTS